MHPFTRIAASALVAACFAPAWADTIGASSPEASHILAWNQIALEAVERAKPTQHQAIRLLAHVSLAQHAVVTGGGTRTGDADAVGTASMRVIAGLLPSQAAFAEERYRQMGLRENEAGARAARQVLDEASADGFAQPWKGTVPQAAYAWRSLTQPPGAPAYPGIGVMRTFVLDSGEALRSGPPPGLSSQRFLDDLAEVRRYTDSPTTETARIAKFYDMTTGTLVAGFWNEQAADLVRRSGSSGREATIALATANAAMMDAVVACHDAKYVYWVPRPSQADPAIRPLIGVPNHPSYPSNHSCISTAAAQVLAHFFPRDRERLETMATEAGISRIYAGLHYRFDVEAGEEIGRRTAEFAVTRHADMLARRSGRPTAVSYR